MAKSSKLGGGKQSGIISRCSCTGFFGNTSGAKYQDEKYGNGLRVFNACLGKKDGYRCTVCGKEQIITRGIVTKEETKKK